MFIQTEKTPNPETIKFIPGETVMPTGTADFRSAGDCAQSPLARHLFAIDGVRGVFLGRDFIAVTKDPDRTWLALKTMVLTAIMEHFSTGQPVMTASVTVIPAVVPEIDREIINQICELLETRVRPAVQQDGGDIEFDRYDAGVVYLRMRGACAGCPSSSLTLKSGVENMLKHFVPEVTEVREADSL